MCVPSKPYPSARCLRTLHLPVTPPALPLLSQRCRAPSSSPLTAPTPSASRPHPAVAPPGHHCLRHRLRTHVLAGHCRPDQLIFASLCRYEVAISHANIRCLWNGPMVTPKGECLMSSFTLILFLKHFLVHEHHPVMLVLGCFFQFV
jgi:hypothetical protein